MKITEVRDLQTTDIESEIPKTRARLFKYRFNAASDEMQRAGEIRTLRRDIARLKTVLRERELAELKPGKAESARS